MDIFKNQRILIFGGGALFVIVLIFGIIQGYNSLFNGTLKITIIPSDGQLQIDNNSSGSGSLSLAPGVHNLRLSRDGFSPLTQSVTIEKGKTSTVTMALIPSDQAGRDYLAAHPDEAGEADGQGSATVEEHGKIITANNPLIQILPYEGNDFRIDYGVSKKNASNRDAVGIYITADSPTAQNHALSWIKAKGYNPTGYEIIYRTYAELNGVSGGAAAAGGGSSDGE